MHPDEERNYMEASTNKQHRRSKQKDNNNIMHASG
jgi:hypothetical protein